ncbi:cytochrome P450 [Nocardia sp. SYP-A9097]|uniref:cytochrome P450 n=1 Tax=Nocardia sp. SYP-A9097 TaxID=2663237 RepID=UPI00129BD172|nr:cytochrome P450 [Nocardia sp. SYP-A9097]MRH90758.1 cytochrome P450 [Nocardia sp. SYP-A9097]
MQNIFDAEFAREPWPVLRSLRAAGGAHRVATPDGPPAWLITRYADVRAGLLDERLSTNLRYSRGSDYRGFAVPKPLDVFQTGEPARMRSLIVGELRLAGDWSDRAAGLIGKSLAALDGTREFDFVERVALPLPAVILGELLGLHESEQDSLSAWAQATLAPGASPRARDTLGAMQRIINAVITEGRDGRADTMLGRLVRSEIAGATSESGELPGLLFYLLFVWYEVLMDVLAGAVFTFSDRPEQLEAMLTAPDRSIAVDELLRFLSPQVLAGPRFAVTDLEIAGQTIEAGQTVLLCLASANHDPERFTGTATSSGMLELDVRRDPNPHVALGHGAHVCVGAGLLRPVLASVLGEIYTHWPNLRATIADSSIGWRSGFRHRGPLTLPVRPESPR